MPVGFKNRTDGNVQVAVDAVRAAGVAHAFAGIDVNGGSAILHTRGNRDCHVILRGGKGAPNYGAEDVARAVELLRASSLPERVMIDLSHDNSAKQPERQPAVAASVAEQIAAGDRSIVGVMLESFLVAGRQDLVTRPHPPARLRPVDHRRLHRLGHHRRGARRSGRRGARAPPRGLDAAVSRCGSRSSAWG